MTGDSSRLLAPAALLLTVCVAGCPFTLPRPQLPEAASGDTPADASPIDAGDGSLQPPLEDVAEPKDRWWFVPDTPFAPDDPDPVWDIVWQDFPNPPDGSPPIDAGGGEGEWECEIGGLARPHGIFGAEIMTHSFFRRTEVLDPHLITVSHTSCGIGGYNPQQEERTYPLKVDFPSSLRVTLECNAPCYAFLMKNGCHYENISGCWFGDSGQVQMEAELLPALYVLGVEFLSAEEMEAKDFQFDLHVALNHSLGQQECQVESQLYYSDMDEGCTSGKGGSVSATVA